MKFTFACVFTLIIFSVNETLSAPFSDKLSGAGFCKGKVKTLGKQLKNGSCDTVILGDIPSADKMISTIITNPPDHHVLPANKPFHVDILTENLSAGFFSDPDKEYYAFPQQLDSDGRVKGHVHITIQKLVGKKPPNPKEFAFFKGIEDKANKKGLLSVDVTPGLAPGKYRICTMTSSFSHQPVLMPVAKRGSVEDCIRIEVGK